MALEILHNKLIKLRRQIRRIIIVQVISKLVAMILGFVILSFFLDYFLIFPWNLRAVLLVGCGIALAIFIRKKLLLLLAIPISDDDLVVAIEKNNPLLKDRLIAAFQFQRLLKDPNYTDSSAMTQKVIADAEELLWQTDFDITNATQATWNVLTAMTIFFFIVLAHWVVPNLSYYTNIWLKRNIFLQNTTWPQRTYLMMLKENFVVSDQHPLVLKIKSSSLHHPLLWRWNENQDKQARVESLKFQDNFWIAQFPKVENNFYFYLEEDNKPISSLYKIITTQTQLQTNQEIILELPDDQICKAKGQTLYLRVFAKGQAPRSAKVICKFANKRSNSTRLVAQEQQFFKHEFPSLMEDFTFYFEGGYDSDGLPEYHVKVLNPPTTESIAVWYQYPEYTGLANTPWDKPIHDGNINAVVGTKIILQVKTNVALKEGKISFPGKYQNVLKPILLTSKSPIEQISEQFGYYYAEFNVQYDCRYQIDLQADNFLTDTNPSSFLVRAINDEAPFVQIVQPTQRNLRMLSDGIFQLEVQTNDDFGIAQLGMYHRVGNQDWHDSPWDRQQNDLDYPAKQIQSKMQIEVKSYLPKNVEGESIAKDTLSFKVYAKDNNVTPSIKESQTIAVIVLSRSEFLSWLQEKKRELAQQLRKVVEEQKDNKLSLEVFMAPDLSVESFDANRILQIKSNQNSISRELSQNNQSLQLIIENIENNKLWNEFPQAIMLDIQQTLTQLSKEESNGIYQGESAEIEQKLAEIPQQIRNKAADTRQRIASTIQQQQVVIDRLERIIPLLAEEDFNDVIQRVDQLRENQSNIREDLERLLQKK